MKKEKVALQLYSVREQMEADVKGTLKAVAQMGYTGAELAGLFGYTAVEMKAMVEEAGLELVSAHVPVEELLKDEVLDDYAAAGLKFIVIPWMMTEATKEGVKASLNIIRGIGERCKARGMQLLYHNHDFEFEKVDGSYILDTFYREIPADLLQTQLDTCWVNVGGEKPDDYVRKYAGKVTLVHLKDFAGKKSENMYALIGTDTNKEDSAGQFEFRPVGHGLQDIPSIIAAADDAGAEWLIVEQDSPSMGKNAMECVKMSIDYLKSIL